MDRVSPTPAQTSVPSRTAMAITVRSLTSPYTQRSLIDALTGVPVYAHEGDFAPALIMWFFDSRSFVSGTGNGPGESIYDSARCVLM